MPAVCWRMGKTKEAIYSAEGGAAPAGAGYVPSSSETRPGGWTFLSFEEGSMPAVKLKKLDPVTGGLYIAL